MESHFLSFLFLVIDISIIRYLLESVVQSKFLDPSDYIYSDYIWKKFTDKQPMGINPSFTIRKKDGLPQAD